MLLTRTKLTAVLLLSAAFWNSMAGTAAALDAREADDVVTVLEKLAADEGGRVYYDEEAAQEWFDIDEQSLQLIPAAGFSRASWKDAFDQTMTGFIASIPPAELEQMLETVVDGIARHGKMTPEQKQGMTDELRAEMGQFDAIRRKGEPYRDIVGPYVQRLRKISLHR